MHPFASLRRCMLDPRAAPARCDTQRQELAYLLQLKAQALRPTDELHPADLFVRKEPIPGARAPRLRQELTALVVPNGLDADPCSPGQPPDRKCHIPPQR